MALSNIVGVRTVASADEENSLPAAANINTMAEQMRQRGIEQCNKQIAQRLIDARSDVDFIVKVTQLSRESIIKLEQKY